MARQIRKTAGALFMAASIGVAMIPTGSIEGGRAQAANSCDGIVDKEYYILQEGTSTEKTPVSEIPYVNPNTTVYTTGDRRFQFAYVNADGVDAIGDSNKFAVILGYDPSGGVDTSGNLEIPEYIQSYKKLSDAEGYCLANVSGDFLYYRFVDSYEFTIRTPFGSVNPIESSPYYNKYNVGTQALFDFLQAYVPQEKRNDPGYFEVVKPNRIGIFPADGARYEQQYFDEDGNGFNDFTYIVDNTKYYPCTADNYDKWSSLDKSSLFYRNENVGEDQEGRYRQCTDSSRQYVDNIPVRYIGNQCAYYDESAGTYKISATPIDDDHPNNGVFADSKGANIVNLTIPSTMEGIGDYAFYKCTGLSNIEFSNGLVAIGNHAFDGCRGLSHVGMPESPRINTIGAYAFKNCPSLSSFYMPHSISMLCDGVFENCTSLASIDLSGDINSDPTAMQSQLRHIGNHLFYGCDALENVILPATLGEGYSAGDSGCRYLNINIFEDCPSLKKVTLVSPNVTFEDDSHTSGDSCGFDLDDFKNQLSSDEFCFESKDPVSAEPPTRNIGALHRLCHDIDNGHDFTYKYLGQELYEKIVAEEGGGTVIYQVDDSNSLVGFHPEGTVRSLSFSGQFGPYDIEVIPDGRCRDLCSLVLVTIPSQIRSIGNEAFKGCHNLQYVYFENDSVTIGTDAFKTQDTSVHTSDCSGGTIEIAGRSFRTYSSSDMTVDNKPAAQLYFVGNIDASANPYSYAMSYNGRFNNASQSPSFARFLSGYPTCQEIEYVLDSPTSQSGKATLVDFPVLTDTEYLVSSSNTKTSYLTADQKRAIVDAKSDYENGTATEDQIAFINATSNLVIPLGVDAIANGLFYRKTSDPSNAMGVTLYGINTVEARVTGGSSDACPPDREVATTTVTFDKYTSNGVETQTLSNVPDADFAMCPNLTSFTLMGSDTKTLNDFALYGCTGLRSLTANCPLNNVGDHCCSDDASLGVVSLNGDVNNIERHAFEDCTDLSNVSIESLSNIGVAPFRGCESLSNVDFRGNSNFVCDNSIIYSTDASGNKQALIECLMGRSSRYVNTSETSGLTGISSEAFAGCEDIKEVDLSDSLIQSIPSYCFEDTTSLRNVRFSHSTSTVNDYAFSGSSVDYIEGTQYLNLISESAFDRMTSTGWDPAARTGDHRHNSEVTICAPENSYFYDYGVLKGYTVVSAPVVEYFNVKFFDYTADSPNSFVQVGETQSVLAGEDAVPPAPYGKAGQLFREWSPSYMDISEDTSCYAMYDPEPIGYNKWTVRFYSDFEETILLKSVFVSDGGSAEDEAPIPTKEGFIFDGWDRDITAVTKDVDAHAIWTAVPEGTHTVYYYAYDGQTLLFTEHVRDGGTAPSYMGPLRDGYTFTGWSGVLTNITADTITFAQYSPNSGTVEEEGWTVTYYSFDGSSIVYTTKVKNGQAAPNIMGPARQGYTFKGWSGNLSSITADTITIAQYDQNSGNNSGDGQGGSQSDTKAKYYTLTVVGGSGSGSYIQGSNVVIVADNPPAGKQFGSWTISPTNAAIASKVLSATVITMPAESVTVTANFVAASNTATNNGTNGRGSGTTNNGNINYWPGTGNVPRSSGTTVVIDKSGLSNTGVVSATVNGSTDNFTIKVTESATASKAVLDALVKQYGSLDNIVYFPFDISLYDAAGTTQIHDTSGLTITITIPIPDSMVPYAANNKVACITNGELDGLNARFTTINGVPCVTFTCSHFSPYVIYVNTVTMTAGSNGNGGYGGNLDNTPKTADPIHPKWFISIALFAISIVLFLLKDKRNVQPARVRTGGNVRNDARNNVRKR